MASPPPLRRSLRRRTPRSAPRSTPRSARQPHSITRRRHPPLSPAVSARLQEEFSPTRRDMMYIDGQINPNYLRVPRPNLLWPPGRNPVEEDLSFDPGSDFEEPEYDAIPQGASFPEGASLLEGASLPEEGTTEPYEREYDDPDEDEEAERYQAALVREERLLTKQERLRREALEPIVEYDDPEEGDQNICLSIIEDKNINIPHYLQKKPGDNFIIEYNGRKECQSLSDLKKMVALPEEDDNYDPYYDPDNIFNGIYYECSKELIEKTDASGLTPLAFGPEDYYIETEYVKVGIAANFYIIKPEWMFNGPVPEPGQFKVVKTGKKKRLVNKSFTRPGANVVSGIHCDPRDEFPIYKLEPILDEPIFDKPMSLGGLRKKRNTRKTNKKRTRKSNKKRNTRKTDKKSNKKRTRTTNKKIRRTRRNKV